MPRRLRRRAPLALAVIGALLAGGGGSGGGGGGGQQTSGPVVVGGSGSGLASGSLQAYLLVGGTAKPALADVYLDPDLAAGELFIVPQNPLLNGHTYTVSVSVQAGSDTFTNAWTFTTNGMNTGGASPLAALNAFRAEAGESSLADNSVLDTSSGKHAGYQAIENGGLTHGEANHSNALFVADPFYDRISIADGQAAGSFMWPNNANVVDEDISSLGGVGSIALLWNTVYHRIPMMRSATTMVGFGDRDTAIAATSPGTVPPASAPGSTGWGYATLDFAGDSSRVVVASHWPAAGATDVNSSFDNSSESPRPIGNTANGTPLPGPAVVGPPIHYIFPTSNNFTAMQISVTP